MVRMIPAYPREGANASERKVFSALEPPLVISWRPPRKAPPRSVALLHRLRDSLHVNLCQARCSVAALA